MKTTRGRRWWLLLSARCHVRSASLATLVCSAAAHRFETHAIGQRGHRFAHEPRCASQRQQLRCELLACHVPAEEGGGQNWPDRADHRHRSSFRRYCTPHSLQGAILSNPVLRPTSTSACAGSDMADSLREERVLEDPRRPGGLPHKNCGLGPRCGYYDVDQPVRHHDHFHDLDRKSTRLNSSHLGISYAVFCLKKKIARSTDRR